MGNQFSSVFDQMNAQRQQSQPNVWDSYYGAMSLLGQAGGRTGAVNVLSGTDPTASTNMSLGDMSNTFGGGGSQDQQKGGGGLLALL